MNSSLNKFVTKAGYYAGVEIEDVVEDDRCRWKSHYPSREVDSLEGTKRRPLRGCSQPPHLTFTTCEAREKKEDVLARTKKDI